MNTGIQDAMVLADTLVSVLSGAESAAVLDRYERERRPIAESVVRLTHRMTRVATMRGRAATAVRNGALQLAGRIPAFRRKLAMDLSEMSLEPRSGG
jgi:2-polyprenyl-6-methoxyphenol hydroxylase-like FAD-dependent oxidoreductase